MDYNTFVATVANIMAAGGEFVIPPPKVAIIGYGSTAQGHKTLDAFVLKKRKEHIKTLSKRCDVLWRAAVDLHRQVDMLEVKKADK